VVWGYDPKRSLLKIYIEFLVQRLHASSSIKWSVSFVRAAHDCELDFFASFFRVLYSIRVRWEGEDKFWWVSSKRELFDVRSFYSVLSGQ
jgi:hypothetical protein